VTVTAYDSRSVTATVLWVASTSGAQAYAHPIDGYAAAAALVATSTSGTVSIPKNEQMHCLEDRLTNNPAQRRLLGQGRRRAGICPALHLAAHPALRHR
jgi:hypothetical protein